MRPLAAGGLWPEVVSFDNLVRAAKRASLGKRQQAAVARLLADREPELLALQRELLSDRYRPGPMSRFVIHDPKRRTISVAPFVDRVVHHAVIDVLEPHLERRMVHASFACRRGKGTHAALDHVQGLARRHGWFLKLDIRRCFESLAHEVVLGSLARCIKDRHVLRLARRIVDAGGRDDEPRRGLPIGSLTSQWWANLVLDRLDHWVLEELRVPGYARYMDDFVLLHDDPEQLRVWRDELRRWLPRVLDLRVKERATVLAPTRDGVPWLGFLVFAGIRRLRPENRRRTLRRWKQRLWAYRQGWQSEEQLADGVRSMMAHLEHGTTRGLRRRWCVALASRGPP